MMLIRLQTQAALLRAVLSGGVATKVIALGTGPLIVQTDLEDIGSPPKDSTVVLVPDINDLRTVRPQLREEICIGKHVSFVVVLKQLNG